MKKSISKDKFMATNFVKPLYRVKFANVNPKLFSDLDTTNLVGNAFNVSNNVSNITIKDTQKYKILPGACEVYKHYDLRCDRGERMKDQKNDKDVLKDTFKAISNSKRGSSNRGRHISFSDPMDLALEEENKIHETWLRVRPAPVQPGETIGSIVLRFVACQLGITALIIIWTAIWVAVIHSYEGPNENMVNAEYVRQQDQLVVDLATELRLITPISPKWQKAITARINEARRQTMLATKRGAKLDPGRYWNLAGTFLFTVYVMTALGFGAPVPQTVGGRCFALLYAVFAIPFHVYLNRSINMDVTVHRRRKILSRLFAVLTAGHCVPIACLLYYVIGVIIFGVGRYQYSDSLDTVDVLMFPLQFTTNGGLASVESYYRVLYGFYVEGAMALLTCSVAALRRYSGHSVSHMTEKYRLFTKG